MAQWDAQRGRQLAAPPRLTPQRVFYRCDVEFVREQWPHFGSDFRNYQGTVRDAHRRLFPEFCEARDRDRWRCLLDQGLVVSGDQMDVESAAALGWAVSWMGATPVLAPGEVSMPAFGLAAWLANLPLRPVGIGKRPWRTQLLA